MQTVGTSQVFIEGVFIRELKNRFLCEVLIDGTPTVCYVPSSCHLENFLSLKDKRVILVRTQTKGSRTPYALLAVPHKRNYLLLNSSMANRAVFSDVHGRRFSFLGKRSHVIREHMVDSYKADLFIEDTKTIIEIKSIISLNKQAIFPTIFSERTQKQLQQIQKLLADGYHVVLLVVSLNPYVEAVVINTKSAFYSEYHRCVELGMQARAFGCRLTDMQPHISKQIEIQLSKKDSDSRLD